MAQELDSGSPSQPPPALGVAPDVPTASSSGAVNVSLPSKPDYEVLERIGRGGYGEVYLARDKEGRFWAVKIVYRVSFDDDRPYEREYNGIQKFKPISHLSASQLQVLHVGRRDEAGYFYYIMELADDAVHGRDIQPGTYSPRTLKSELKQRKRISAHECCHVARALAVALENLHQHGLVHRDIKPANIIFVNGRPKLADVGLVTNADLSMSCAGTEGYIPLEGPGRFPADIYSLGKVLYEICTGFDRRDFPKLPENFEDLPDHALLLKLNRIITKACETNLRKRYRSAAELRLDLERLMSAQSTTSSRNIRRLASIGVVGLLIASPALFWFKTHDANFSEEEAGATEAEGQADEPSDAVSRRQSLMSSNSPLIEQANYWTNSLGMIFLPVANTRVLFCIWETRVQDFEAFASETRYDATVGMVSLTNNGWKRRGDNWRSPGFNQDPTHPVCGMSWEDAGRFCAWLTAKERQMGKIGMERRYRLPTDGEWSAAIGSSFYPWGTDAPPPDGAGNYAGREARGSDWPKRGRWIGRHQDSFPRTSPVGSFLANQYGFYDLGGNVWEWCEDWYHTDLNRDEVRSAIVGSRSDGGGKRFHVLRGASWENANWTVLSSGFRNHAAPGVRRSDFGFRCVVDLGEAR